MTKQEVIAARHEMWTWIADEIKTRQECVSDGEYWYKYCRKNGIPTKNSFAAYTDFCGRCAALSADFKRLNSNFIWACYNDDVADAELTARQIAQLPEREDVV